LNAPCLVEERGVHEIEKAKKAVRVVIFVVVIVVILALPIWLGTGPAVLSP